jgi:DNA-binding Lrp family transcriptional regulator
MSDIEFDIINELYFVTSFRDVAHALDVSDTEISANLEDLVQKGYVKCFYPDPDTEVEYNPNVFFEQCRNYYFLATKEGLLAHNSR